MESATIVCKFALFDEVLTDDLISTLSDADVVLFVEIQAFLDGLLNGEVLFDEGKAKCFRRLCTMGVDTFPSDSNFNSLFSSNL